MAFSETQIAQNQELAAVPATQVTRSATGLTRRIPELDGLRGIAITLVLIFHFTPVLKVSFLTRYFVMSGWMGVDLFFVLSGYLITGILVDSVGRPGYYRNFILRRALRILPLYYGLLIVRTIAEGPHQWKEFLSMYSWWYFAYLGNIQVFLQNKWPVGTFTHLWSLQVEEQFYLTFPLLVAVLSRKALARTLMGAVAAALLLRIVLTAAMPMAASGTYVLMPCRMDTLALGGLIAIAQRDFPAVLNSRWIAWMTAAAAASVVFICWRFGPTPWTAPMRTIGFTAIALLFGGMLVLLIGQRHRALLALCRLRALCWIGIISYGVYLLMIPTEEIMWNHGSKFLRIETGGFLEALIGLLLTIGAAAISWRWFESPILRLRNRWTVREEGF